MRLDICGKARACGKCIKPEVRCLLYNSEKSKNSKNAFPSDSPQSP